MATNIEPSDTSTQTRLRGRWLLILRIGWIVLAVTVIVLYLIAIPNRIALSSIPCNSDICTDGQPPIGVVEELEPYGVTTLHLALYYTALLGIIFVVYTAVSLFIFWQRSDDWMALLLSLVILMRSVSVGPELATLVSTYPIIYPLSTLIQFIASGLTPLVLYLFPDGRFKPRWTAWLTPIWLIIAVVLVSSESNFLPSNAYILLFALGLASGVIAQVIRYRHYSTPIQRQQTKWIVLAFAIAVVWLFIGILPSIFLFTPLSAEAIFYQTFRVTFFDLPAALLFIIGLAISLMRYRLWDVDFVINRSLVYGGLTTFLAALFALVFFVLQAILTTLLGSNQLGIAAGLAGILVAVLFNPTRRRIRHFVDRRFYGIQIEVHTPSVNVHLIGSTRTQLADFTNLEPIGSGGMADIYRAKHPILNQTVAIKVLPENLAEKEEFRRRFVREGQVVSKLQHPNIVKVFDYGESDGESYMVMAYLSGGDLSDLLSEQGRFSFEDAVSILKDIASALDYAHKQDIIHRDVKPSNVMLEPTDDSEFYRAILTDFGIARIYAAITKLTATGGLVGTLDYIAPEQIQGVSDIDGRADIYSLAVMAYQMLTGELPFKKDNPSALLMAHLMQPPPDACDAVSDLPQSAADAMMQAMAKQREERFTTAGEMIKAMSDDY